MTSMCVWRRVLARIEKVPAQNHDLNLAKGQCESESEEGEGGGGWDNRGHIWRF